MVTLRKRKAATETTTASSSSLSSGLAKAFSRRKTHHSPDPPSGSALVSSPPAAPAPKGSRSRTHPVEQGDLIPLSGFGGAILLTDGATTTLESLVDISVGGVVLFTYPKANTPGCIKQACLFRDAYQALSAYGFAVYGLSTDPPRANRLFKAKNSLPYTLICDESGALIAALGLKKPPASTRRGVVVLDKHGRVLASMTGGPGATVEAVLPLIEHGEAGSGAGAPAQQLEAARKLGADRQTMAEAVADVGAGVAADAEQADKAVDKAPAT